MDKKVIFPDYYLLIFSRPGLWLKVDVPSWIIENFYTYKWLYCSGILFLLSTIFSFFVRIFVSDAFLSRHIFSFFPSCSPIVLISFILSSLISSLIRICAMLVYHILPSILIILFIALWEFRNTFFTFLSVPGMQCVVNTRRMNEYWWSNQETVLLAKLFFFLFSQNCLWLKTKVNSRSCFLKFPCDSAVLSFIWVYPRTSKMILSK